MGEDIGLDFRITCKNGQPDGDILSGLSDFLRKYVDFTVLRRFNTVCLFDFTLN